MEGTYEYANAVIWGLAIYVSAMLAVGYYASKKVKNTTDYVLAGRRLGVFFTTGSTFATWFGAGTCMGAAGYAYIFGNQGVIIEPWGAGIAVLLMGLFFARLVRRGKFVTLADFYTSRYGKTMGAISIAILALADMGWLGGLLVAFGAIINYFAGFGLVPSIMISTLIVVVYTYMGGMWAVTLTDVFQMLILIFGIVALFFVSLSHYDGGLAALFSNTPSNWSNINQWSFVPTPESAANPEFKNAGFLYYTGHMGWFYWIASWVALGIGGICTQSLQQRFMAAKDEKTAVRAGFFTAILYMSVAILPVLLGMMYFKLNPNLTLEQASNEILLRMAVDYLHPAFAVIFVVALIAAIMSSGDSVILGVSAIAGKNLVGMFKNVDENDPATLKYIKFFVPVVAFVSMAIALYFKAILNLIVLTACLGAVSLFAPFVFGFLWKKANTFGSWAASIGGCIAWIAGYFIYLPATKEMNTGILEEGVVYFDWAMWDAAYISSVWAFGISIALMIIVSLLTQKIDAPKPLLDVDGNHISTKNMFGFSSFDNENNEESSHVRV